ncbi:MAG: hypothetical protein HC848_07440 [Limnobacter sp.]|nr:hypothetical protein [Limnobacter sp.]
MTINFHNTHFEISASRHSECPGASVPEIVFVGRSNAGKSTTINTLCQQRQLAYASKTPGRTQLLNFFFRFWKKARPLHGWSTCPATAMRK